MGLELPNERLERAFLLAVQIPFPPDIGLGGSASNLSVAQGPEGVTRCGDTASITFRGAQSQTYVRNTNENWIRFNGSDV
jgi:hypothetical protein